jgi:hypothetical protein
MMADGRLEELERRVRTAEEEANGEKHLTRYAVEQTQRNGDVLHALRTDVSAAMVRLDHLGGDMAGVKSALAMHGRALDVLMQDVRQLRVGQEELRHEMQRELAATREEAGARHAELRQEMQRQLAATQEEAGTRHAELRQEMQRELAAMREEAGTRHAELQQEMRRESSAMREEAGTRHAELLAAIQTRGGSPPA